ncbi:MAG: helicase-related protein [Rhodococcus sp. (in: high G+C Gram-positive bacteria)]
MRGPVRITGGFDRPEIRFEVDTHADESATFDAAVRDAACQDGQGLVYVDTRADTENLARELSSTGTELRRKTAAAYHGGMRQKDRDRVAEAFAKGDLDLVVATSAFGMGIDKGDIRFVIHAAAPGSVDSYYQEAGRPGRDGRPALARLHYYPGDLSMQRFFATRKVDESLVRRVVGILNHAGRSLPFGRLRELVGARSRKLTMTTNLLVDAGAVICSHGRVTASEGTTTADAVADAKSLSETERKVCAVPGGDDARDHGPVRRAGIQNVVARHHRGRSRRDWLRLKPRRLPKTCLRKHAMDFRLWGVDEPASTADAGVQRRGRRRPAVEVECFADRPDSVLGAEVGHDRGDRGPGTTCLAGT